MEAAKNRLEFSEFFGEIQNIYQILSNTGRSATAKHRLSLEYVQTSLNSPFFLALVNFI
jgi:hypothetical protein